MSAYTVTVTQPGPVEPGIDWSGLSVEVSRQTVDTLEEARQVADRLVDEAFEADANIWPERIYADRRRVAQTLPDTGVQMDLPDGSTVSVKPAGEDGVSC